MGGSFSTTALVTPESKAAQRLRQKEEELHQKEEALRLREQQLQQNGKPKDVWAEAEQKCKAPTHQDEFVSTLAARVVMLESQKMRVEEALQEALAKRDGGTEVMQQAVSNRRGRRLSQMNKETPTEKTVALLDKLMRGVEPEMVEIMGLRDAVLTEALKSVQPGKKLQHEMAAKLELAQAGGDSEVHAALVQQLLNNQSEADFMSFLNEAEAPDHPPLPGMTYAEWLTGQATGDCEIGGSNPLSRYSNGRGSMMLPAKSLPQYRSLSEFGSAPILPPPIEGTNPSSPHVNPGLRGLFNESKGQAVANRQNGLTIGRKSLLPDNSIEEMMHMLREPSDPVMRVLAKVDDWQFDSFELNEVTNGRPLSTLAFALFKRGNLMTKYQINECLLARFLYHMEDNYSNNPYHNCIHAADVLRTLHVIVTRGGVGEALHKAQDIAVLATYTAAVVHDYEHRGVNNDFLVKTRDTLAITYNDRSPMENHHAAAAWGLLLGDSSCAAFSETNVKLQEVLRKMVVDLVLATDMKQHFSMCSLWDAKIPILLASTKSPDEPERSPDSQREPKKMNWLDEPSSPRESTTQLGRLVVEDEELRTLVLQAAMKCADLGHLTHTWDVHKKWVELLEEEMWRQGDAEKARNMTVSPLMDRAKGGITKSQQGFFDFVVLPQLKSFCKVFPKCTPMLEQAMENYNIWVAMSSVPES